MRSSMLMVALALVPAGAVQAQVSPSERVLELLPPDLAAEVVSRMELAEAADLPAQAMANLALEGVAKGRSAEQVLGAVDGLAADMGRALDALEAGGRVPQEGDVEAAAAAMRMGVDAESIAELAAEQPSGRRLAVPLLVIGGLAERGLPADDALAAVSARMAERAGDADLLGDFPEVGQGLALGVGGGPGLAPGLAGLQVPAAGINVPVGPPAGVGGRPENHPGRGNGPPGGRGPGG